MIPHHGPFAEDIKAFSMVSRDRYIAKLSHIFKTDYFGSGHSWGNQFMKQSIELTVISRCDQNTTKSYNQNSFHGMMHMSEENIPA